MIYITGDTHGDFGRVQYFCRRMNTSVEDIMIVLGDAGINYYQNTRDIRLKQMLSQEKITLFCIHGNHEIRPANIPAYKVKEWHGGNVYFEEEYPNILFGIDGEIYDFNGKKSLVIGGAYSVDKMYRLMRGYGWWEDEQPSNEIKAKVEAVVANNKIDIVLSHTCPLKYEPVEVFLKGINQLQVDKSTEEWLDRIESDVNYEKWYCGHYHTSKKIDKMQFMFEDIEEFLCQG